ncbi:hypothetical protein [Limnofasciculus baicalensis]|uniref:Uncharacterized protein n=1 Tax=Limnofasciculus baicalensis BBK-W-15 TaxID=2699891 RepID=A0AAE3GVQ1_9CYAN|nr:hypothetical protein [Limnofasciculus baicalensis]MCP2729442.1 hypothetical protein [Limnofasciculus baicalensis BBK-W-15]
MGIKLSASIFAIIASLTSIAPVFANPLPQHESWINSNNLAANPQALCSDIIGTQVDNNKGKFQQNDIESEESASENSYAQSHDESDKTGGGGGVSFFGIGANGQGENSNSKSDKVAINTKNNSKLSRDGSMIDEYDLTKVSNIAVGKNCDAFSQASSQRDQALFNATAQVQIATVKADSDVGIAGINADANKSINLEQQLTNRAAVEAKKTVQLQQIDTQAQVAFFNALMQGW